MKILVTGGCGFIGSNLIRKLLDQGHTIYNIDNYDDFYSKEIKLNNIKLFSKNPSFINIKDDIRNSEWKTNLLDKGIQLIIHFLYNILYQDNPFYFFIF